MRVRRAGAGLGQTSYMALSKALSSGTPQIDRWHWETHDDAYTNGDYYSVKPPGLVLATLPLYRALDAAGGRAARARGAHPRRVRRRRPVGGADAAHRAVRLQRGARDLRAADDRRRRADDVGARAAGGAGAGGGAARARRARRRADRAGTGVATAITLGTGTLVLPFSTMYFSHILAGLLGFAAFALVWREREREREGRGQRGSSRESPEGPDRPSLPSTRNLALAGLAVVCEYPLAITAGIVGLYALMPRAAGLVRRAVAYGGGVALGVAPLLAYQWWRSGHRCTSRTTTRSPRPASAATPRPA